MTLAGRIIVLDDEPAICDIVVRCLQPGGYAVKAVQTGEHLRRTLAREAFDLLILDLNLRGEDGLTILGEIRRDFEMPTIILTARGEPVDRVVGLELGADDYVPKPFEPRELLARVRSVLRRMQSRMKPETPGGRVFSFDELSLNPQSREVFARDGKLISLTTTQFDILHVLVTHPNKVLTRDQIMTLARDKESTPFDRSIDVHVGHLRRKLERNPQDPTLIKTVHGVGYIFSALVVMRSA